MFVRVSAWVPLLWLLVFDLVAAVGLALEIVVSDTVVVDYLRLNVLYTTTMLAGFLMGALALAFRSNDKQSSHVTALTEARLQVAFHMRQLQLELLRQQTEPSAVLLKQVCASNLRVCQSAGLCDTRLAAVGVGCCLLVAAGAGTRYGLFQRVDGVH